MVNTTGLDSFEVFEALLPHFELPLDQPVDSSVLDSTTWANALWLLSSDLYSYEYVRSGHGEVSGPKCNNFLYTTACVAKGDDHRKKSAQQHFRHCKRLACPECYESASERTARRISERHLKLDIKYREDGLNTGADKHWSLSFDKDLFPIGFFLKDGGKEAFQIGELLLSLYAKDGFFGGELLLHLERRKHDDGTECRRGKKCRQRHHWEYGPHLHYTGKGYFYSDDLFEDFTFAPGKAAYLLHRIEDRGGGRDVQATIRYELTHSAQLINKATGRAAKNYRYVGIFKDCLVVKVREYPVREVAPCCTDGCLEDRHHFAPKLVNLDGKLKPVPDDGFEADEGVHWVKRTVVEWDLKRKPPKDIPLEDFG